MPGRGSATMPGRATCTPARRRVAGLHGGRFPAEEASLRALPGIGGLHCRRDRGHRFQSAGSAGGRQRRPRAGAAACPGDAAAGGAYGGSTRLAAPLAATDRPGDFAQALMDLGATVCRPRRPDCAAMSVARRLCGDGVAARRRPFHGSRRGARSRCAAASSSGLSVRTARYSSAGGRRAGCSAAWSNFPSTPWRELAWSVDEATHSRRSTPMGRVTGRGSPYVYPLPPSLERAATAAATASAAAAEGEPAAVKPGGARQPDFAGSGVADPDEEGGKAGGGRGLAPSLPLGTLPDLTNRRRPAT